jgi:hypothetical protein
MKRLYKKRWKPSALFLINWTLAVCVVSAVFLFRSDLSNLLEQARSKYHNFLRYSNTEKPTRLAVGPLSDAICYKEFVELSKNSNEY